MNNENEEPHDGSGVPRARARWVGACLVVLGLTALVWQAHEAGPGAFAPPVETAVESLAQPSLVEMLASVDAKRLGAQAASAVAAARDAGSTAKPDETEVCGIGRVKAEAGQPKDMAPIRQASMRLREKVLPLLLDSRDDLGRGAGLLMQALGDTSPGDGVDAVSARARDELATLAAFKGSPQLYAWAMRACQQQRGEGACRMLSAEQWARVEPRNAMAWLHVAADAHARGDAASLAEAMYRVSQAPMSDARWGSVLGVVFAKLPPEADLLSRVSFGMDMLKIDARAEVPLVAASQYCGASEVRDANRHQVCAGVAELLMRRGSTLAEASLGASIGERVGWPADRVTAAGDERDAIAQMSQDPPGAGGSAWSCSGLARSLSQLLEKGQQGELAAMRSALKHAHDSPATLAKRYRDSLATRVATAASAASAVSPP